MPELPEVETVVRHLRGPLTGRRIAAVQIKRKTAVAGSPASLRTVIGRQILKVYRRGKFIRMELEGGWGMAVHLRMTGWLGVIPTSAKDPRRDPYERVRFALDDGANSLVFRDVRTFGRIWCGPVDALERARALARLGPEPLTIDAEEFAARLRRHGGRLKSLLLNQEFLAGLGNIYVDEALFAAGLHPLLSATRVTPERARRLHTAIQEVLTAAIAAGGTSIISFRDPHGREGLFKVKLLAYGREGEPCSRCGAAILRIVTGQRGTWFCPRCQRGPRSKG